MQIIDAHELEAVRNDHHRAATLRVRGLEHAFELAEAAGTDLQTSTTSRRDVDEVGQGEFPNAFDERRVLQILSFRKIGERSVVTGVQTAVEPNAVTLEST